MASNQHEQQQEEQSFTIQPHPHSNGHQNFPGSQTEATPGLGSAPTLADLHNQSASAFGTRGDNPHVISSEVAAGLEPPASREELQARQAELNK
ncbi:hypothetical protein JCM8097_008934 [Rhodosporidiobolus ruineniae]